MPSIFEDAINTCVSEVCPVTVTVEGAEAFDRLCESVLGQAIKCENYRLIQQVKKSTKGKPYSVTFVPCMRPERSLHVNRSYLDSGNKE